MSENTVPPGQTLRVRLLTYPLLNALRIARPAATGCAACGRPWTTERQRPRRRGHLAHYQDSQPLNCERCGIVMDVDCYRRHVAVTAAERLWWASSSDDEALVYIMVLCRGCRS